MKRWRLLLVDDHELVRAGIRMLLETLEHVEIVGEASDGFEVLELARKHHPDIVLMDLSMKGLGGLDATSRLRRELPDVLVIILSMHADDQHVQQALKNGAKGYMLKDSATQELELALTAVMKGDVYLSPAVSRVVVNDFLERGNSATDPLAPLTPRQREVLKLIAQGQSTKEIAYQLKISAKTVESHRAQLMERLAIHDVASLVRFAINAGLVKADS